MKFSRMFRSEHRTTQSEGRQMKQCGIKYWKNPLKQNEDAKNNEFDLLIDFQTLNRNTILYFV